MRARRTAPNGEPSVVMPVCVIKRCIGHPVARGLASRCPENSGNRPQEQGISGGPCRSGVPHPYRDAVSALCGRFRSGSKLGNFASLRREGAERGAR